MNQGHTPVAASFESVSVTLGGVKILDRVSAIVPRGGCTAVIGPNGAGKTTLMLALLGQIGHEGKIRLSDIDGRPSRLGYVPQRLEFDRGSPVTALDLLVMARQRLPVWLGVRAKHRAAAMAMLADVQAEHLASRRLGALSGGELQRVLLAAALQQNPDILLLDEPNAGVDIKGEMLFCELLERLRRERSFSQFMVTHDLSVVTAHATHVICLNRTVLGEGEPRSTLTQETLFSTFGLHLGLPDLRAVCAEHDPKRGCSCPEHKQARLEKSKEAANG